MGNLEIPFLKMVGCILQPFSIILIREIPTEEGPPAFLAGQASLQDRLEQKSRIFQFSLSEQVLQGGRVHPFDFLLYGCEPLESLFQ